METHLNSAVIKETLVPGTKVDQAAGEVSGVYTHEGFTPAGATKVTCYTQGKRQKGEKTGRSKDSLNTL